MSNDPGLRRLALGTLLGAFPGTQAPAWAVDLVAVHDVVAEQQVSCHPLSDQVDGPGRGLGARECAEQRAQRQPAESWIVRHGVPPSARGECWTLVGCAIHDRKSILTSCA